MIIKSGYQIGIKALQELTDISIEEKELIKIKKILKEVIIIRNFRKKILIDMNFVFMVLFNLLFLAVKSGPNVFIRLYLKANEINYEEIKKIQKKIKEKIKKNIENADIIIEIE